MAFTPGFLAEAGGPPGEVVNGISAATLSTQFIMLIVMDSSWRLLTAHDVQVHAWTIMIYLLIHFAHIRWLRFFQQS